MPMLQTAKTWYCEGPRAVLTCSHCSDGQGSESCAAVDQHPLPPPALSAQCTTTKIALPNTSTVGTDMARLRFSHHMQLDFSKALRYTVGHPKLVPIHESCRVPPTARLFRRMMVTWAEEEGHSGAIVVDCDELKAARYLCICSLIPGLNERTQWSTYCCICFDEGSFCWGHPSYTM